MFLLAYIEENYPTFFSSAMVQWLFPRTSRILISIKFKGRGWVSYVPPELLEFNQSFETSERALLPPPRSDKWGTIIMFKKFASIVIIRGSMVFQIIRLNCKTSSLLFRYCSSETMERSRFEYPHEHRDNFYFPLNFLEVISLNKSPIRARTFEKVKFLSTSVFTDLLPTELEKKKKKLGETFFSKSVFSIIILSINVSIIKLKNSIRKKKRPSVSLTRRGTRVCR